MNQLPWASKIPLVALGYRAGSGKDTVADYLVAKHGFVKVAFAGALKRAARDLCGFTEEQVNGSLEQKEAKDPRWGFSPRWFMQRFGTEVGRAIDSNFWVRVLDMEFRRYGAASKYAFRAESDHIYGVVISDLRFPNELAAVREWGGLDVEVWRPEAAARKDAHASETSLDGVKFSWRLENTGSLEDLYVEAKRLVEVWEMEKAGVSVSALYPSLRRPS